MTILDWRQLTAAAILAAGVATGAQAQELRIGLSTELNSLDPHYFNLTVNNQIAYSIFNTLITQDETRS